MAGALLDAVLAEIARGHDRALVLETSFRASGAPIAAHFLAVPDPGSLSKLLDRLAETAVAP
jgi:chemotaxis protein CheY-P-specific phosphatase CheC